MSLEFENAIAIQPVEGSGSGLQFQNTIYIQPKDEGGGGDTPTGTGDVYVHATGKKFTGTTFSEQLDLFTNDNTEAITDFPLSKTFKCSANNVIINNSETSFRIFFNLSTSPSVGAFELVLQDGAIKLWCNFRTMKNLKVMDYTAGESYDLEMGYNGSGTFYVKAKLSSSSTWQQQTYSYSMGNNYVAKAVSVGTDNITADIRNIKVECNNNVLFDRT